MYATGSSESLEPVYKSTRRHMLRGWEFCRSTGCIKAPEIYLHPQTYRPGGLHKAIPYCRPTNVRRQIISMTWRPRFVHPCLCTSTGLLPWAQLCWCTCRQCQSNNVSSIVVIASSSASRFSSFDMTVNTNDWYDLPNVRNVPVFLAEKRRGVQTWLMSYYTTSNSFFDRKTHCRNIVCCQILTVLSVG
jgi:hypothetical protein